MNDESGLSAAPATQEDCSARCDWSDLKGRLELDDAVLSSTDLRALGYPRRAIDAIWRNVETQHIPGYSRPLIRVADLRRYLAACADRSVVR